MSSLNYVRDKVKKKIRHCTIHRQWIEQFEFIYTRCQFTTLLLFFDDQHFVKDFPTDQFTGNLW